ncbi:ABC transporter ATP-binding protein [Pseudobacillus wudalianchiensis]|uniref:High-affinity branched-chain amino acid ABC transporter ATP-binding protein LivG n=1 Tax=Pseudobacillus wudalianchiensis TaxID=1743143 RepID=A0A1B9AG30_9BACI|nr:ABC transporter ATP-binding protein [Bacillus wudalianchiensis]OCA82789.1 high-affinity branched-chain amino acid ABC transporter ATP-binding protein LivG [Bacillus wudalianchiensis]
MSKRLLEVKGLTKAFGGVVAVSEVDFHLNQGEIVAVIGPNGAGKTTLFNMITGVLPPTSGQVFFDGKELTGKQPYQIAEAGITRTFQNLQVFENMSVIENVMTGVHCRLKTGFLQAGLRLMGVKKEEQQAFDIAMSCLEKVGIADLAFEPAEVLPYGNQRLLEIARASASSPQLILLDEPMAGLNPQESRQLVDIIKKKREEGMSFLFVEHDMETVMGISDRIVVIDYGKKIAEGTPAEIYENEKVIAAYLGTEDEEEAI